MVQVIDVEKAIRNSDSGFVRRLPKFVVALIRRIIHERELNEAIQNSDPKTGMEFIDGLLANWKVTINAEGTENIPQKGRFIFTANHPLGGLDALAFLSTVHRFFPEVGSPSNELFEYIPHLRPVIIGINVFGKNSREKIIRLDEKFNSDIQIVIFPAGEVSRRVRGKVTHGEWKKTFISKAIQHQRDVIPVHILGKNSSLFYFIANLRKFLGIRMYFETILLPREMLRQRNSTITLKIGKPIPWQELANGQSHHDWAEEVKRICYSL
jgi:putative hemolysin